MGYVVHGIKRRSSSFNTGRIEEIYQDPHVDHPRFVMHYGDMSDATNLIRYAYWIVVNYREAYGMYACNGILFNHESPLRGETFVTRKITRAAAAIHLGKQDKLYLGNLDAKRDWGHAREYVRGMWLMMQQDEPENFVLATGETTEVRQFVQWAFEDVGVDLQWRGTGVDEKGYDTASGKCLVEVGPRYFRPTEVDLLLGDPSKAKQKLGWSHETSVRDLAREMVQADLKVMKTAEVMKEA